MKTAVATSAAQWFGFLTARKLAASGERVFLTDIQDVAYAASIAPEGIGISGNVSDEAFVESL